MHYVGRFIVSARYPYRLGTIAGSAAIVAFFGAACVGATLLRGASDEDLGTRAPRGKVAAKAWLEKAWALADTIPALVKSADVNEQRLGFDRTKTLLKARLLFVTGVKQDAILRAYLDLERHDQLLELIDFGLLAHPESTREISSLLKRKAVVLNRMRRFDDALKVAKQYYNVAPMSDTADALQLVHGALVNANPNDPAIAANFKKEQVAGARFESEEDIEQARMPTSTLLSIKIDSDLYATAIGQVDDFQYGSLMAKGNLLLLADRGADAVIEFKTALSLANEKDWMEASESVGRAIRAADGSVGRANAWISSASTGNHAGGALLKR